jgi:hypothetical protein
VNTVHTNTVKTTRLIKTPEVNNTVSTAQSSRKGLKTQPIKANMTTPVKTKFVSKIATAKFKPNTTDKKIASNITLI